MNNLHKIFSFFIISLYCLPTSAQEVSKTNGKIHAFFYDDIEFQAKFQLSVGGASPMGIPAQIREIEGFKPKNMIGIEMNATKWLSKKHDFAIRSGLKFEGRGMRTQARVKNYYTQIEDDTGAQTKGFFTGHVITEMENLYFTIPVLFLWNATEKWNFYGGLYFSTAANKSFSGYIYDGSFREGTPIGELTVFEGTSKGLYDFSEDLRSWQWGNQLGAEFKTPTNWRIFADVTMANSSLFKSSFESISFKMYNIYGNFGVSYEF